MRTLSERERRFVEAYTGEAAGNGSKAAVLAGYSTKASRQIARRLLTRDHILGAIDDKRSTSPSIATRQERREFWTAVLKNADVPWRDRLKASELLGKSEADFIERREITGHLTAIFATPGGDRPAMSTDEE